MVERQPRSGRKAKKMPGKERKKHMGAATDKSGAMLKKLCKKCWNDQAVCQENLDEGRGEVLKVPKGAQWTQS